MYSSLLFPQVSKIVGHRTIKGRRQFLVRWKNYSESADTWENEKDLNCQELMEEYLSNEQEGKTPPKLKPKMEKSKKTKNISKKTQNGMYMSLLSIELLVFARYSLFVSVILFE